MDPENELRELSSEQIADEEDTGTKYFCRVENIRKKEELHFLKLKKVHGGGQKRGLVKW